MVGTPYHQVEVLVDTSLIRDVCFFFFALIRQGLRWPADRPGPPSVLAVDVSIGKPDCFLRSGKSLCLVGVSSSPDEGAGVEASLEKIIYAWQGFRPLQTRMLVLPSELPR